MRFAVLALICLTTFADTKGDPWRGDQVIQVANFAKQFPTGKLPAIFMVGPRILYNGNHIKGAIFAGPAGTDPGIALLKEQTAKLLSDAKILIYCGCCPMDRCPNIRPAFAALRDAGFKNVKILEIPTNLKADWTDKSYPVEKGDVKK